MLLRSRSLCSSSSIVSGAFCLIVCGALTHVALAQTPLTLRVAQESVVAGGWAQIKVFADQPTLITRGSLALDLDPQVFGPVERVATFSANGDAMALARVDGTHVEISIGSLSGGIGQLPEVPVVAMRVPVLAEAKTSGFVSLSFPANQSIVPSTPNYPADSWGGPDNRVYSVTLVSGRTNMGIQATISDVSPGAGFQSPGTVLTVSGSGFTESSQITAPGLAFSSIRVISATKAEATLASAAEITGARFRLEVSPNNFVDYFVSPLSAVTPVGSTQTLPSGSHVTFPLAEQRGTSMARTTSRPMAALVQNPTLSSVEVRISEIQFGGAPSSSRRVTLAPGDVVSIPAVEVLNQYLIDSDTPLRMLQYNLVFTGMNVLQSLSPASPWGAQLPPITLGASPNELMVNYQMGGIPPAPRTIRLFGQSGSFTGGSTQVAGAPWLSASQPDSSGAVTVSFDPSGLAPGTYNGTITATPAVSSELSEFPVKTAAVQVTLVVSTQPTLIVEAAAAAPPPNTTYFSPTSLTIQTNGTSAAFTASAKTSDGGNWLSIDRTSGMTPATINIQANTSGLAGGYYDGTVTVAGPSGPIQVRVSLVIYPIPKRPMTITPELSETREEGVGDPTETLHLSITNKSGPVSLQISTDDGANWLSARVFDQNLNAVVMAYADSAALAPGTYRGTITATAGGETAQARVTLSILPKPVSLLRASPSSLHFVTSVGIESPAQTLRIDSDGPALISVSGPAFARIKNDVTELGIAPVTLSLAGFSNAPGTYTGSIIIKNSFGSTTVPVTVDVTGSADREPVLSSVVNAASHRATALAPGEMITLRGIGIGPQPTGLRIDEGGRISTNVAPETRVEINGQAAPVLYASPNQWNVIVPYEVAEHAEATVRVLTYGASSRVWTLPVAPAAPAIFTIGSSGVGQGAVLNQDNTVNSPANPAPAGTIIQIFATGGGQSSPPAATGSVTPASGGGGNQLPVKVFFADDPGSVVFAGPAPGFASGALQVNAVVPPFGRPTENKTLRLSLEINGVRSTPVDVTIR